jgi:hypothetical protein
MTNSKRLMSYGQLARGFYWKMSAVLFPGRRTRAKAGLFASRTWLKCAGAPAIVLKSAVCGHLKRTLVSNQLRNVIFRDNTCTF